MTAIMTTSAGQDTPHLPDQDVVVHQGTIEGHCLGNHRHPLDSPPVAVRTPAAAAADRILQAGRILRADPVLLVEDLPAARILGCSLLRIRPPGDQLKAGMGCHMSAVPLLRGVEKYSRRRYPTMNRSIPGAA